MVRRPIISMDGQSSERKRQISAMQWTIGTLSVNSPSTKSPVIPSSLSTNDEISELERTLKSIKYILRVNIKNYIFSNAKTYFFKCI